MTDDEKFVARMADLVTLTDRSLVTVEEFDLLIALARIGASVAKLPREIYVATGLDDNNDQLQYGGADYKGEQS